MSYPFSTPTPQCRQVSPYACSCGLLRLDPSLPAVRLNYAMDAHLFGLEQAARIQMNREQMLVRIEAMGANR